MQGGGAAYGAPSTHQHPPHIPRRPRQGMASLNALWRPLHARREAGGQSRQGRWQEAVDPIAAVAHQHGQAATSSAGAAATALAGSCTVGKHSNQSAPRICNGWLAAVVAPAPASTPVHTASARLSLPTHLHERVRVLCRRAPAAAALPALVVVGQQGGDVVLVAGTAAPPGQHASRSGAGGGSEGPAGGCTRLLPRNRWRVAAGWRQGSLPASSAPPAAMARSRVGPRRALSLQSTPASSPAEDVVPAHVAVAGKQAIQLLIRHHDLHPSPAGGGGGGRMRMVSWPSPPLMHTLTAGGPVSSTRRIVDCHRTSHPALPRSDGPHTLSGAAPPCSLSEEQCRAAIPPHLAMGPHSNPTPPGPHPISTPPPPHTP